jgi:nucleotide-binding universal stress UspA family protein
MKIETILLTTDLSPESLRPFQPIKALAQQVGAKLILLHVVVDLQVHAPAAPFAPKVSSPDLEKDVKHAQLELEEQRASLGDDLQVATDVIAAPDVAKAICAYAKEHDADLIAISTHGRKGLRHLALGSVAEQVIRHSSVPVMSFHRNE